jgi:uridylate kinase
MLNPTGEKLLKRTSLPFLIKRVLLKLSGEALMGGTAHGIDPATVARLAQEIKKVHDKGMEVTIVIGGGNICRGVDAANHGIERTTADYMGMLATVINALALQSAIENLGVPTCVQSAIPMESICETYIRRRAESHIQKKRIVIFAGGSGNPYFTTDTCAVLRASEMNCDVLLKGTKVDGIYTSDPHQDPTAKRFDSLTYEQIIRERLAVMDIPAIALARDNHVPLIVCSIQEEDCFIKALQGEGAFTLVHLKEK